MVAAEVLVLGVLVFALSLLILMTTTDLHQTDFPETAQEDWWKYLWTDV